MCIRDRYCTSNELEFSVKLVYNYLDHLMKYDRNEKYMHLFERFKDYILSRKIPYNEKISSDENMILQDKKTHQNRETCAKFYRDFIELLLKHKAMKYAKLVFHDQTLLKLATSEQDYINGVLCYKDSPDEVTRIFKLVTAPESSLKMSENFFAALLRAVSEKPQELNGLFETLLNHYFYPGVIDPVPSIIHLILTTFMRTRNMPVYMGFLRFLYRREDIYLKRGLRDLCLKIVNSSRDEIGKSQLRGLIDEVFAVERVNMFGKDRKERAAEVMAQKDELEPSVIGDQINKGVVPTHRKRKEKELTAERLEEIRRRALEEVSIQGAGTELSKELTKRSKEHQQYSERIATKISSLPSVESITMNRKSVISKARFDKYNNFVERMRSGDYGGRQTVVFK
eukprot:TRINITY_DN12555_c0_g1_i7.p1 TRINITY_DN12555_c0_g1~~TRINITY_DN12555_c0_g1_i7.p1  ORF type:complete len:422 (-),score=98.03 TRINITY_DN12555_c0_g1_i7:68-1261(-)